MKKVAQIILAIIFLFQFSVPGQSQILRRAANRLGQKVVEKKVDQEIERKTDEIADSIVAAMDKDTRTEEEKAQSAENRKKAGGLLGKMMGGINQVELPSEYVFEQKMVMEMEDEKGNITVLTMYHKAGSSAIGYEAEDKKSKEVPFIVMDFEKEYLATFTENDGEKQVMSMPLPMNMIMEMAEAESENKSPDDYSIERTGKTRTINGFNCEEYVLKDEDMIQHMWVTQDVDMGSGFYAIVKNMANENKRMGKMAAEWPQGYPIEVEILDRKKNKKSYMRTREISAVNFTLPASEYSYMSFGN